MFLENNLPDTKAHVEGDCVSVDGRRPGEWVLVLVC